MSVKVLYQQLVFYLMSLTKQDFKSFYIIMSKTIGLAIKDKNVWLQSTCML